MNPFLIATFIILIGLLCYFIYKRFFESRYDCLKWKSVYTPESKVLVTIIYTDKLKSGIQEETICLSAASNTIVKHHISSKNKSHRRNFLKRG